MVIFHSYVGLPEGNYEKSPLKIGPFSIDIYSYVTLPESEGFSGFSNVYLTQRNWDKPGV